MALYAFILGNLPGLGISEIASIYKRKKIPITFQSLSQNVVIANTENELPIALFGSVIKIIKISKEFPLPKQEKFQNLLIDSLAQKSPGKTISKEYLLDLIFDQNKDKKITFGLSVYGFPISKEILTRIGLSLKKELKNAGVKSRFVAPQEQSALSSVVVKKQKITEIAIIITTNIKTGLPIISIGKTNQIFDFEDLNKRDFSRPFYDRRGMLPLKIAKMMINVATQNDNDVVYDPFCGYGSIAQEALLLNFESLNSDIDSLQTQATKTNLEWLSQNYSLRKSWNIFTADARSLPINLPHRPSTIVTEGYLGPFLKKSPSFKETNNIFNELSSLYIKFLKNAPNIEYLAIIFPFFGNKTDPKRLFLKLVDDVKNIGYTIACPLPKEFYIPQLLKLLPDISKECTFLYQRTAQIVGREIVILKKINKPIS